MTKEKPNIKVIQKRVANISIGASTLRGQGALGIVENARKFLAKLDLREFKDISERQFSNRLEKYTNKLMEQFPEGAKNNWGAARKAINVFLELPLDGNGIIDLKPGDDEKFQKYAKDLANEKRIFKDSFRFRILAALVH
ncbi:MAG: hypothetical protein QMC85_02490 [Methanocellales archaeon]|nr:hypothetical protein [Methanocellales archaeon]